MSYPFPYEAVPLLLDWYRMNARPLPWRDNTDPYRILVSEIMLQQTRAETVKPYFKRFLDTLPTVQALAEAPEEVILKLWEGLGYYSRVRNLQKAAQTVVSMYGGVIPADFNALLHLPGVGRYTAGAVASIAFHIPVPAVDGNVLRVMARLCDDDTDVMSPHAKTSAESALAPHIPSDCAGDFTQSMIELGALICLPGEPKCEDCPLRLVCRGLQAGHERSLPVRNAKTARRVDELTVLLVETEINGKQQYCIHRRKSGLLDGLYEFPNLAGHLTVTQVSETLQQNGIHVLSVEPLPDASHLFSHVEWRMKGYFIRIDTSFSESVLSFTDGLWVSFDDAIHKYTIPSAFSAYKKYLIDDDNQSKK